MVSQGGEALKANKPIDGNLDIARSGTATESKREVLCFSLNHLVPQGTELEAAIKERVPSKDTKIVVISEYNMGSGIYNHIPEQRVGVLSIESAYSNLRNYYGENISFMYADDPAMFQLFRALRTEAERQVTVERTFAEERRTLSITAAFLYLYEQIGASRSIVMEKRAEGIAKEAPNAVIVLVAGAAHVNDIAFPTRLTLARRDREIELKPIKMNQLEGAEADGYLKIRESAEQIAEAIGGIWPFIKVFQNYERKIKNFPDSTSRATFINGDLEIREFAAEQLRMVVDLVYGSELTTQELLDAEVKLIASLSSSSQ